MADDFTKWLSELVAGFAVVIAGWVWRRVDKTADKIDSLSDKVGELQVDLAKNYATHGSIRLLVNDMLNPLHEKLDAQGKMLERIERHLNGK